MCINNRAQCYNRCGNMCNNRCFDGANDFMRCPCMPRYKHYRVDLYVRDMGYNYPVPYGFNSRYALTGNGYGASPACGQMSYDDKFFEC